jgi:hypothetical protein
MAAITEDGPMYFRCLSAPAQATVSKRGMFRFPGREMIGASLRRENPPGPLYSKRYLRLARKA